MGKMTLWRAICLAKVVYTMETVVLNNLPSVRMTPPSSQTPTLDFMDRGHLDGEMTLWRAKYSAKLVGKVQ